MLLAATLFTALLLTATHALAQAPAHVVRFAAPAEGALVLEADRDLQVFDGYSVKRRIVSLRDTDRPGPWRLYGRLGLVNFQNELTPHSSGGLLVTWRRTGPGLGSGSRVYIAVQRRF
jgi:hypothetical protein